jgi:two-component system chemotaxis response regulator CheB
MKTIKVLIVDDSLLIQKILTDIFNNETHIEVVGTASNGKVALEIIARCRPDVVTMDIEMPEMDGIQTLKRIMTQMPTPVVMLSSYSKEGAELTFKALDLGAVDFITKPHPIFSRSIMDIKTEILMKINAASRIKVSKIDEKSISSTERKKIKSKKAVITNKHIHLKKCRNIVSIGVSTGGPQALKKIIPTIPSDINAAILIVQHMPLLFTRALADRLNVLSSIDVCEAGDGNIITHGKVFIAKGDHHLIVREEKYAFVTSLDNNGRVNLFRPSIDVLMKSTAELFQERNTGVIMTGMCRDGVEGAKRIKEKNGKVIAQDQKTSVVYGMNKLVIQAGYADKVVPLSGIVPAILDFLN